MLVFSDDWGRHPSSCQHLVHHLLDSLAVCWVNTIGTRRPSFSPYSLRRSWQKLGRWLLGPHSSVETEQKGRPLVLEPIMWPSFHSPLARRINRTLLERAIERRWSRPRRAYAVTTLPVVSDLVSRLPIDRWIYYCVDDLSQWPGLDGRVLAEMEKQLVTKVDAVVAVSERLADRMRELGREATLLSHGIDLEFWQNPPQTRLAAIESLPPPRVVFWGVIDRRIDMASLELLSQTMAAGSIILVGPENDSPANLGELEHTTLTGPLPIEVLPAVARLADVLIMPYADLPVTRAMQPLKFKEYLATRKPAVVTRLPAVMSWQEACDVTTSPQEFVAAVLRRVETGTPRSQQLARARLEQETWERKAEVFHEILTGSDPTHDVDLSRHEPTRHDSPHSRR